MKKILVAAAALFWAGSGSAAPGDPNVPHHAPAQLNCSECHVMHASRAHNYDGTTTVNARYNQGTGHAKLLVADGTNATCLACHDSEGGGTNTDVFQTAGGSYAGGIRSAGGLNGTVPGKTADAAYMGYMGHTLGSLATPPGWDTTRGTYSAGAVGSEGFNCSHCHAVHGGAADAFRNLGGTQWMGPAPFFGDAASAFLTNYPTTSPTRLAAFDSSYDAPRLDVAPDAARGSKAATNVTFGSGSGNANGANGMNRYCANCHGNFHGASTTDAGGENLKHPTSGSNDIVARMTTGGAQFNVTRPMYTASDKTAGEVGCLTCHKAHGNLHSYALIWPANGTAEGALTNFEEGNGTAFQSLCKTCHPQASAF